MAMAKLSEEEFSKNVKKVDSLFASTGARGICR